ncbi:hypothetical protein ACFMKD_36725, partial [Acinetobacter baumannii]
PLGGAAFNNEFGRPALNGYFRTFEQNVNGEVKGFHKPIMIAGGYGNIRPCFLYTFPSSRDFIRYLECRLLLELKQQ